MTREEIIDGLEIYTVGKLNEEKVHITVEELQKFIDAIKALEQDCTDVINREAVLKCFTLDNTKADIWNNIKALPPVTPHPKTGHWIEVTNGRGGHECNQCGEYAPSYQSGDEYLSKFCPNCGAKMQEVE